MKTDSPNTTITRATPINELPELLTPEEFRSFIGIGRGTMYELLRRGDIPHQRFGRLVRISKSVLASPGEPALPSGTPRAGR
jgi:excisionase family DNA binding protein